MKSQRTIYKPEARPVSLVLWWSPDQKETLESMAKLSDMTLEELVDEILDDWAESMSHALDLMPRGVRVNLGRFVRPAGESK